MSDVGRRALLLASLTTLSTPTLVACTQIPPTPQVDPDRVVLTDALERERRLLLQIEHAAPGAFRVAAREVVNAHIALLQRILGQASETASAMPSEPSSAQSTILSLSTAADKHSQALRDAGTDTARVLSSLSASNWALVTLLRLSA